MTRKFSFYGIILGAISLFAYVFEPFIRDTIQPKPGFWGQVKRHIRTEWFNQESVQDTTHLIVIGLAITGLILAIIGYIQKEDIRMVQSALFLCLFALAFNYVLIAIGIFAFLLLLRYLGDLLS